MPEPRDRDVESALRQIRTPEHGEGFWETLEAQIDSEAVVPMRGRSRFRPRQQFLAAAAAVLLVGGAVIGLSLRDQPDRGPLVADQPPVPSTGIPTDTTVAPTPTGESTPDGAVRAWIDALGEGDIDRAVDLTGPRTARYFESLGGNVRGYLTEAQEGYGAWAASPDLSTTEVELPLSSQQVTVVVVSGTWTGEGDRQFRTDALPVVRSGGGWLVEPSALGSVDGGQIEITTLAGDGAQPVAPEARISVAAKGAGGFFFSLDDGEAVAVEGEENDGVSIGRWDPPGRMAAQSHLLVVAYLDGDTLTATAATFRAGS